MRLPDSLQLLSLDNEDEILTKLDELEPAELLELQAVADKITELVLIVFLAREEYGEAQQYGNTT